MGQEKAMLALKSTNGGARQFISFFDRGALIRVNPGKNQVPGNWKIRRKTVDRATFVTHPRFGSVWVKTPEAEPGGLGCEIDSGVTFAQHFLLAPPFDRDPSEVSGDRGQAAFLRQWSALFFTIHGKGTEHIALR